MAKNQSAAAEAQTAEAAADAPKATEGKDKAFSRIVSRRMSNALSAIKLMESNANKANYIYTDDQVARMIAALYNQVSELEAVYAAGGKQAVSVSFGFEGEPESKGDEPEGDEPEGDE